MGRTIRMNNQKRREGGGAGTKAKKQSKKKPIGAARVRTADLFRSRTNKNLMECKGNVITTTLRHLGTCAEYISIL